MIMQDAYQFPMNFAIAPRDFNYITDLLSEEAVRVHYEGHHLQYNQNLVKYLEEKETIMQKIAMFNNNLKTIFHDNIMQRGKELRQIIKYSLEVNDSYLYNNSAQVWNHNLFWLSLKKNNLQNHNLEDFVKNNCPITYKRILYDYENFLNFINEIITAPTKLFGNIWIWIVYNTVADKIEIKVSPNAGTLASFDYMIPLLTIDIWEHAYYLQYRNKKQEFISQVPQYLNWELMEEQLKGIQYSR